MLFKYLFLLSFPMLVTADCPTIVSRKEWEANPPKSSVSLKQPVNTVVIHHTVKPDVCLSKSTCISAVKNIQTYHQKTRKWLDIGYSFLIGGDGNVYEGRGWLNAGSHARNYNSRSYGISFIGDYTNKEPTANMIDAAQKLINCGVEKGYLTKSYKLFGHRQVTKTECPGNKFYDILKKSPHFSTSTR